jgi:FHS family L-fucose permease-like MFS transporter
MLLPFILVSMLFPLWGFANDATNPLAKAFKDIYLIPNAQSSMVQFSFYLGYRTMAIAALNFYS